jgi:hypothetical protein
MFSSAVRTLFLVAAIAVALALGGCATVTGTPTQSISIHTVDANDRPVDGMRCRVVNGSAEYFGTSPMYDLQVRRSSSDLDIECRRGALVARGTAVSRGSATGAAVKALMPGGTASLVIDHVSGYRYAYPSALRLRVGQHLVFDASDDALGRPSRGIQVDAAR